MNKAAKFILNEREIHLTLDAINFLMRDDKATMLFPDKTAELRKLKYNLTESLQ